MGYPAGTIRNVPAENRFNCTGSVNKPERSVFIMADGKNRADIHPGMDVSIVLKQDQKSGKLTRGIIKDLLTKSGSHPHGIKVRLETGLVGRVKVIHG